MAQGLRPRRARLKSGYTYFVAPINRTRNLIAAIFGAILICLAVVWVRLLVPYHGLAAITRAIAFWFGFAALVLVIGVMAAKGTER